VVRRDSSRQHNRDKDKGDARNKRVSGNKKSGSASVSKFKQGGRDRSQVKARVSGSGSPVRSENKDNKKRTAVNDAPETRSHGVSADMWRVPVSVSVETEAQLKAVIDHKAVNCIFIDEACFGMDSILPGRGAKQERAQDEAEAEAFAKIINDIHDSGKKAGLRLRRIERDTDPGLNSRDLLRHLIDMGAVPDAVLIRSYDEAMMVEDIWSSETGNKGLNPIKRIFDYTCYGYNTEAVSMLLELGADGLTYPIELTYRECMSLRRQVRDYDDVRISAVPYDVLVYGHLPMMVSANCIQRTSDKCDHKNRILALRDRMQKDMPVRCYCKYCYNQIFNAEPLVLYDLETEVRSLDPECVRYDFTVESGKQVIDILAGLVPRDITRGHFRHGIE